MVVNKLRASRQPRQPHKKDPPPPLHVVSTGTGFFINQLGHILTNEHVVNDCSAVQVRLPGGYALYAEVLQADPTVDLAAIGVDPSLAKLVMGWEGQAVTFRFRCKTRLGEKIVVFGFPLTGALSSKGNLTTGNITAFAGPRDDNRLYQISAPVQPGNSGGPLFDENGCVIGIVVS